MFTVKPFDEENLYDATRTMEGFDHLSIDDRVWSFTYNTTVSPLRHCYGKPHGMITRGYNRCAEYWSDRDTDRQVQNVLGRLISREVTLGDAYDEIEGRLAWRFGREMVTPEAILIPLMDERDSYRKRHNISTDYGKTPGILGASDKLKPVAKSPLVPDPRPP